MEKSNFMAVSKQLSQVRVMLDKKQLENMEYFSCVT